jgi:hypothetical protein
MASNRLADPLKAEIAAARRRGAAAAKAEPRATSARYDRGSGRVTVELTNGCAFEFPAALGQGLENATPDQLDEIEVLPGGRGLRWEGLDADLSVAGLLAGTFGSESWMARQLGRRGGSRSSEAKAAAARENGKKGGRPPRGPIPAHPSTTNRS